MSRLQKLLTWLLMLGAAGLALLATAVWQFASWREPVRPGELHEERSIGFFDPHLHVRLLEVIELEGPPDRLAGAPGSRQRWVRLAVRSSASELLMDPSRLSVTVRSELDRFLPVLPLAGPSAIDGVPVRRRFAGPLETEASQEAWFAFDLPAGLGETELWISKDSWLHRIVPGWERAPLHDKAVYALSLPDPEARVDNPYL